MEENPFATLVNKVRNDSAKLIPAYMRFGKVISTDPLKIDVAGTVQDQRFLLKNSALTYFYIGDRLLLMPIEDEQRYVIVCKVADI